MLTVLDIVYCVGMGVTVSLLTLRPRRNSPPWPPLDQASDTVADHGFCETARAEAAAQQRVPDTAGTTETEHTATTESSVCSNIASQDTSGSSELVDGNTTGGTTILDNGTNTFSKMKRKDVSESTAEATEDSSLIPPVTLNKRKLSILATQTRQRRVLFVIAHPDDECMFFGPSILHFTQNDKAMVFLICLTNGSYNSPAVGKRRQHELWASCERLGIPAAHVTLYRCRHLPDHPGKSWPIVSTANIINRHLHTLHCDMAVTFDGGGVSGHINHRSLHSSLCYLVEERLLPAYCHAYCLDTVNIVRKYSSVLDLPLSMLCSDYIVSADRAQYCLIRSAMRAHASQYVWFRKLYMVFSRYVVINTLGRMTPSTARPPSYS